MAAPQLLSDLPALKDTIGWGSELKRIQSRLENCPTPHVLGIHGNWGSGKTSFMRQLQLSLGGEMPDDGSVSDKDVKINELTKDRLNNRIVTIWFDAWRYQNEITPIVALLQVMREQMEILPKINQKFKKLGDIALEYTLNSLSDIGKSIGIEGLPSAEKIKKVGGEWEREHFQSELNTDAIRKNLHKTIKCLLPSKNSKIIVFIDDLDRCNPKAAIRLLEGLKIYLSIPDCVFVLGMNESILVDAIREEISAPKDTTSEEMKLRASHYLEKICGDIYRLPLPENPLSIFVSWIESAAHKEALKQAVGKTICLPPNVRKLKALANQWSRFASCINIPTQVTEQKVWAVRILVVAYIHQFHRDIWERWHFNYEFWHEFMAWCEGNLDKFPDGTVRPPPKWASVLKQTQPQSEQGNLKPEFPNPGDIDIFWMDALIRQYKDHLTPNDFKKLIR